MLKFPFFLLLMNRLLFTYFFQSFFLLPLILFQSRCARQLRALYCLAHHRHESLSEQVAEVRRSARESGAGEDHRMGVFGSLMAELDRGAEREVEEEALRDMAALAFSSLRWMATEERRRIGGAERSSRE